MIKEYYREHEPLKFNCVRFIYIEHAIKKVGLSRAVVLANCFLNMYTLKSGYGEVLNKEIEKCCPYMFRSELRVPDFYLYTVKSKISKLQNK